MKLRNSKKQQTTSLLLFLVITGVILTAISWFGRTNIYSDYACDLRKEPMLTVFFRGWSDGIRPWNVFKKEPTVQKVDSIDSSIEDEIVKKEDSQKVTNTKDKKTKKVKKKKTKKKMGFGEVDTDYFNEVLFLGDSRTVGLSMYSYLSQATYCADKGVSVYDIFDKKIAKTGKKKVKIETLLKKKEFHTIYIMLGVNELGTGTDQSFAKKYSEVIDRIRELQPDSYIVIQSIMNLGKELSTKDEIFNNENIAGRNEEIKKLADNKHIFYLDINPVIVDEEGYIPKEYTFDSIHLKAKYYNLWADFLCKNGIVKQ